MWIEPLLIWRIADSGLPTQHDGMERSATNMPIRKSVLVASCLLLASGFALPAVSQDFPACMTQVAQQEMVLINLVPHIQARVNGEAVFLKFDSGLQANGAVTRSAAARLKLKSAGRESLARSDISGVFDPSDMVELEAFSIGDFTAENLEFVLMPQETIKDGDQTVDGVLGSGILQYLDFAFETRDGRIAFVKNNCKIDYRQPEK